MTKCFLGLWKLIPESCKYDAGQAPLRATYSITPHAGEPSPQDPTKLNIKIQWIDIQNKDFSVSYELHLSGKMQAEQHSGVKMQVFHELTKEGVLKSTSFTQNGENIIMEASRELKQDEKFLDVLMLQPSPKGPLKIYQRYEKVF